MAREYCTVRVRYSLLADEYKTPFIVWRPDSKCQMLYQGSGYWPDSMYWPPSYLDVVDDATNHPGVVALITEARYGDSRDYRLPA